ncbi:hypothetical protein FC093_03485 [Ilyomonas limi]|uniref:Signal peptidase I n=1 Tax=Ilyomonas limi TaxID=2575867 RepID=A0A4U3L8D9_9BACT|nr:DUF5684 domain-containing protein [Ilyomonas limi]TKK70769.1 hypothetical protein FC093_03485 [Ilyomonas limi]
MILFVVAYFAYIIAMVVATWKIYEKAGQPGWAAIIPFYNIYILLKIVGKPAWWLLLLCIPVVNIVFGIWTYNILSKSFGKDELTTLLMFIFGIGILQLGFGDAQYQGPYGDPIAFQAYSGEHTFDFEQTAM